MEYPSKYIEKSVQAFSRLPGIGRKSALRMVIHLLNQQKSVSKNFTAAISDLLEHVKECPVCHMVSDTGNCSCQSARFDRRLLCVVKDLSGVFAIQNTDHYNGLFHVLGGLISPIDGISPENLHIRSLIARIADPKSEIEEVIFAFSSGMEAETTIFYIARKLEKYGVKISTLSVGVPIGSELEYTDEVTLGRSIANRVAYHLT